MIGGYRIERKLSAGGFDCSLFTCADGEGQRFAIKEYLPRLLASRYSSYCRRYSLKTFVIPVRSEELLKTVHWRRFRGSVVSVLNFFPPRTETVYMVMNYLEGISQVHHRRDLKIQGVSRIYHSVRCLTKFCATCASCTSTNAAPRHQTGQYLYH
jgi:hypothetical protein